MNRKTKWKYPSRTKLYYTWRNLKNRCFNKKSAAYKNYGGRGISACDRWKNSYDNFYEDMASTYKEGLTLDRIDVNGNYEPDNCRWATWIEQHRNKRDSIIINGIPLKEHAERMDVSYDAVWKRIKRYGITPEEAINPKRRNLPKEAECGSRQKYRRDGCRCEKCKAGNARLAREFRAKRKAKKAVDISAYSQCGAKVQGL